MVHAVVKDARGSRVDFEPEAVQVRRLGLSFGYQNGGQGTVAPTINGSTLTMTLKQALTRGQADRIDVIAGTDRDEDLVGTATTAAQYTSLVDTHYGSFASQVLGRCLLNHFDSPGIAWSRSRGSP